MVLALVSPRAASAGWTWQLAAALLTQHDRNAVQTLPVDNATGAIDTAGYLTPSVDDDALMAYAMAGVGYERGDRWYARLRLDTGLVRPNAAGELTFEGNSLVEEAAATGFVREARAAVALGDSRWLTLGAGRRRDSVAADLIYSAYGFSAGARADGDALAGIPLVASTDLILPRSDLTGAGWSSLLAVADLRYELSFLEWVGVFAAVFVDGDDALAELEQGTFFEMLATEQCAGRWEGSCRYSTAARAKEYLASTPGSSDGRIAWVGASTSLLLGAGHQLSGLVSWGWGAGSLRMPHPVQEQPDVQADLRLQGLAAQLGWEWALGRVLPGAFLLLVQGSAPELTRSPQAGEGSTQQDVSIEHGAFPALVPWLTHTNILLQGGLDQAYASPRMQLMGVAGRGVLAAGTVLQGYPTRSLALKGTAALLWATDASPLPETGRLYGLETDFEIRHALLHSLELAAELDLLLPGDFFDRRDPVLRARLGVYAAWP